MSTIKVNAITNTAGSGDVEVQLPLKMKEVSDPSAVDGFGHLYVKLDGSSNARLYFRSNDVGVTDLTAASTGAIATSDNGGAGSATDNSIILYNGTGHDSIDSSSNLTFDGSTLAVTGDATISDDLGLTSDAAEITFGANNEVELIHNHDKGLILKHTATGDNKPVSLVLQTGETDIQASDVIGSIDWQAPDETTDTDSRLICATISAVSEGDFSSSNNAVKLSFRTGNASGVIAAERMSLSSTGLLTVNGGITSTTVANTLGATSFNDANITDVGDIDADSISVADAANGLNIDFSNGDTTTNKITLKDNLADALNITESSNSYMKFTTTDSGELITIGKNLDMGGNVLDNAKFQSYKETINTAALTQTSTSNDTVDFDLNSGNIFTVTLTNNVAYLDFLNMTAGQTVTWIMTQHGSSAKTVSFDNLRVDSSDVGGKFHLGGKPIVSSSTSAVDVYNFYYDGTSMFVFTAGQSMAE